MGGAMKERDWTTVEVRNNKRDLEGGKSRKRKENTSWQYKITKKNCPPWSLKTRSLSRVGRVGFPMKLTPFTRLSRLDD
jgi:hypothetical protein